MNQFNLFLPLSKSSEQESPIKTRIVETTSTGETRTRYKLKGVASTTSIDRDEEIVSKICLQRMANQINGSKIPIFGNHDHNWENMLGFADYANIDGDKLPIEITTDYEETNPKVKELIGKLQGSMPLMLSIGGKVKESRPYYDKKIGKEVKIIDEVDLLETSIVGIGANPDAYIGLPEQVLKYLKGDRMEIEKSSGQAGMTSYGKLGEETVEAKCPSCGQTAELRQAIDGKSSYFCNHCGTKFEVEKPSKVNETDDTTQPGKKRPIDGQVQEKLPQRKSLQSEMKLKKGDIVMEKKKKEADAEAEAEAKKEAESEACNKEEEAEDEEYKRFKAMHTVHHKEMEAEARKEAEAEAKKAEGKDTVPGGENALPKNSIKSASTYESMKKAFKESISIEEAKEEPKQESYSFKSMRDSMLGRK